MVAYGSLYPLLLPFDNKKKTASVYTNSQDSSKRDHFSYSIGWYICPGIHLAECSLFTAVARMIWGLTIQLQKDENGVPIPLDVSQARRGPGTCCRERG